MMARKSFLFISVTLCDEVRLGRARLEQRSGAEPHKIGADAEPHYAGKLRDDVDEKTAGRRSHGTFWSTPVLNPPDSEPPSTEPVRSE